MLDELIHAAHQPGAGAAPKWELALSARATLDRASSLAAEANLRQGSMALRAAANLALPPEARALLGGISDLMLEATARIRAGEPPRLVLGLPSKLTWTGPNLTAGAARNLLELAASAAARSENPLAKAAAPLLREGARAAARALRGDVKVEVATVMAQRVAFRGLLDLGRGTFQAGLSLPGLEVGVNPRGVSLSWRMAHLRLALVAGWGARRQGWR